MSSFRLRGFDPECCGGRGGSGLLALGTGGLGGGAASAKTFGSTFSDLNFRTVPRRCGDGGASAGETLLNTQLLGKEPLMADPVRAAPIFENFVPEKRELEAAELKGEGFSGNKLLRGEKWRRRWEKPRLERRRRRRPVAVGLGGKAARVWIETHRGQEAGGKAKYFKIAFWKVCVRWN